MDDDFTNSPEWQEWASNVRAHVLQPMTDSQFVMSLVPKDPQQSDIKFAVELGMAMMLDKPLVMVVQPGTKVPDKIVRVADAIFEWDPDDPDAGKKMRAKIDELDLG